MPPPVITTKRLMLRPLSFDDADGLVRVTNDVSIARMMATTPYPFQFGDALALIRDYSNALSRGEGAGLAITRAGKEPMIGVISYSLLPPRADIGFWIGTNSRGKGYAGEAIRAILRHLFGISHIEYVTAGAFADNEKSLALQNKMGFKENGRSKRLNYYRNAPTDHVDMIIHRSQMMPEDLS